MYTHTQWRTFTIDDMKVSGAVGTGDLACGAPVAAELVELVLLDELAVGRVVVVEHHVAVEAERQTVEAREEREGTRRVDLGDADAPQELRLLVVGDLWEERDLAAGAEAVLPGVELVLVGVDDAHRHGLGGLLARGERRRVDGDR